VRLEPLEPSHEAALHEAAADGALWNLWYSSVAPRRDGRLHRLALAMQAETRLPWVVRSGDRRDRRHDELPRHHAGDRPGRVGYTWYARAGMRSHVNSACKLLLLSHAFEHCVCRRAFRSDRFNVVSQRAIVAPRGAAGRHPAAPVPAPDARPRPP
jgi:hypothetical protein